MSAKMCIEPFEIAVPEADLQDLKRRLTATRWACDLGNADWRYGVEGVWLREMAAYWRDEFDWRRQESAMNALPHFQVTIGNQKIHFLYIRGRGSNPTPLILTHGWPWTFWDYSALIGPLTDPGAHGGDPAESFDLVIPSLPGFGFSPLCETGVDVPAIATLWVRLMRDALGYSKFAAAGGDWGAAVTAYLGHAFPEVLTGIYCTMAVIPGLDPATIGPEAFAHEEQWMLERNLEARPLISSHIAVQTRDPQTLAYGLADSPVGMAAWLWERRRAWSDCDGEVLRVFDRDALCTLASIYWLTGTIGTSFRLYAEQFATQLALPTAHAREPAISVPTAIASFAKEVSLLPRAVVAEKVNLVRWSVFPDGGHFAPSEHPEIMVHELKEFFRQFRNYT